MRKPPLPPPELIPGVVDVREHTFNHDLLAGPLDLEAARANEQFGGIAHVLYNEDLLKVFQYYDETAGQARKKVRRLGLIAVAGAALTLLGAATEFIWGETGAATGISLFLECIAILALVIACEGLGLGKAKKDWLESRLKTERLRQWHFQMLICRMAEIDASGRTDPRDDAPVDPANETAKRNFQAQRQRWFKQFLQDYLGGNIDSLMNRICQHDQSIEWMHTEHNPPLPISGDVVKMIEAAYLKFRFAHQADYASHVLRADYSQTLRHFLRWPLERQRSAIRDSVGNCLVAAFVCSVTIIACRLWATVDVDHHELVSGLAKWLSLVALSLTIVSVALRTIQEGLGINNDIERYRTYQTKILHLQSRFLQVSLPEQRFKYMKDMEMLAFEEMKEFLRIHRETRFVL